MGLFSTPKKPVLPENARCSKCGRKIRKNDEFEYIDRKLYCRKCARAKKDWDFLALMAQIDD